MKCIICEKKKDKSKIRRVKSELLYKFRVKLVCLTCIDKFNLTDKIIPAVLELAFLYKDGELLKVKLSDDGKIFIASNKHKSITFTGFSYANYRAYINDLLSRNWMIRTPYKFSN